MSITVEETPINVTLPANSVRMLIVQPHLTFQTPLQEPFPLTQACTDRLMNAIPTVFELARTPHCPVILFPEFGIPGIDGVERIRECLATAASSYIVIGGVRGLSKNEYARLCAIPGSAIDPSNAPDQINDNQWINTSVTFIKDDAGTLSIWIQPKISPSWPEANVHHQMMYPGRVVRVFRARFSNGVHCRFFTLLCFDWVGREDGLPIPDMFLREFNSICQASGSRQDIQWAFVLQHNDSPNHTSFLNSTNAFLSQTEPPFVRRADAAVVMVSTASTEMPSRGGQYGYTSICFSPRAPFDSKVCQPTFATQSSRLRASEVLGTCKDVVFREMGECIHRAEIRVPNFVVADPTDRTAAIVQADTIPLSGAPNDPRIPGRPVPAVVKWANDELDVVPDFGGIAFTDDAVQAELGEAHLRMVGSYRTLPSQDLTNRISGACASHALSGDKGDPAEQIDSKWGEKERLGLRHVIQTLTFIDGAANLDAVQSRLHARHDGNGVEIAAICGTTHSDCQTAFARLSSRTYSPILFVSRDDNNLSCLPRELEHFADVNEGTGIKLTDAQTLVTAARSKNNGEYRQFITELLNVPERRII